MSQRYRWLVVVVVLAMMTEPGHTAPPTDRFGDPLPAGALLRLGTSRLRHGSWITSVAYSSDGKLLASADYDGAVCLWDAATGAKLREIPVDMSEPNADILSVAISPDNKVLATGGADIRLWDIATGKKIRRMDIGESSSGRIRAVAFSPGGKTLASAGRTFSADDKIPSFALWDVATGKMLREFAPATNEGYTVAFSPDGKMLAGAGGHDHNDPKYNVIGLWDVDSGKLLRTLPGTTVSVRSVAFSSDGKMLASATEYDAHLWDVATGKPLRPIEGGKVAVAFSAKGSRLATAGTPAVFDPATGRRTVRLEGESRRSRSVAFSPDGSTVVAECDFGGLRLWDAATGKERLRRVGHRSPVLAVAFSPDGNLLASGSGGEQTVRLWGTATGAEIRTIPIGCTTEDRWERGTDGRNVFFLPDGKKVLSWSCDHRVHVWDISTGVGRDFRISDHGVLDMALSPDGTSLAICEMDSTSVWVTVWQVETGKQLGSIQLRDDDGYKYAGAIAFSPDGKTVAVAYQPDRINDTKPPRETVALWEVGSDKILRQFRVAKYAPSQIIFSPDGRSLVTGESSGRSALDGKREGAPVQVWDVATGKEVRKIGKPGRETRWYERQPIAVSPDGKLLATAGEKHEVVLWELDTGKEIQRRPGHARSINALAFSPDGRRLASASVDSTVLVWEVKPGEKTAPAPTPEIKPREPAKPAPAADRVEHRAVERKGEPLVLGTGDKKGWLPLDSVPLRPGPHKAVNWDHPVYRVFFSPDGRVLATMNTSDHTISLWEAATGAPLRKIGGSATGWGGDSDGVSLFFANDGRTIVGRSTDGLLRFWDLATSRVREMELGGHWRFPRVVPSPGGKLVASVEGDDGEDNSVVLRDLATLRAVRTLKPFGRGASRDSLIRAVAFSADGRLLATGLDTGGDHENKPGVTLPDTVVLWNVATGERVRSFRPGVRGPTSLAFSPDARLLIVGPAEENSIQVWEVATGAKVRTIGGPADRRHWQERVWFETEPIALSPDGKYVAGEGANRSVVLWEVATGQEVRRLHGHTWMVTGLAFAPDGKSLVSGSADTTILLWDLGRTPAAPRADLEPLWQQLGEDHAGLAYEAVIGFGTTGDKGVALLRERLRPGRSLDPAQVPQLIADLGDADAKVREKAAAELKRFGVRGQPALIDALRGKLTLDARRRIELTLEAINDNPTAQDDLRALRAIEALERIGSPKGEELLAELAKGPAGADLTTDARLALHRLQARRLLKPVEVLGDADVAAARRPLVGSRTPRSLPGHPKQLVTALLFSQDGKLLVSAGRNSDIRVWDVAAGRERYHFSGLAGGVNGLALSADGRVLASAGGDGRVRLWDTAAGRQIDLLEGHKLAVLCVAFSPDGKVLVSGDGGGTIRLWDVGKRQFLREIDARVAKVTSLAFSPDGKVLVSGGLVPDTLNIGGPLRCSQPAAVALWDPATGKDLGRLAVRGSAVAFSPDGATLIASGEFCVIERGSHVPGLVRNGDECCFLCYRVAWWDWDRKRELRMVQDRGGAVTFSPDGQTLAVVTGRDANDDTIMYGSNQLGSAPPRGQAVRLWETAGGKEVLRGPAELATAIAFAPDGRTLAWARTDGSLGLWDLAPEEPLARFPKGPGEKDLEKLWDELTSEDAGAAYQAVWTFAATGSGGVAFLGKRLRPIPAPDGRRVARLIADLDSNEFAVRESASAQLAKWGLAVEPVLRGALGKGPAPEARRRIEDLLDGLKRSELTPDEMRALRAVQVLERIASVKSQRLLRDLARGEPHARLTIAAQRALKRLGH